MNILVNTILIHCLETDDTALHFYRQLHDTHAASLIEVQFNLLSVTDVCIAALHTFIMLVITQYNFFYNLPECCNLSEDIHQSF